MLSLVLFLPGMIVPAAQALGHSVDAEKLHHLIDGEPQADTIFGVAEEDSDCHHGFNVDPSQCTHAHMAMAAMPVMLPALPDILHPHFDIVRGDIGHRITSAPPLRPPQA
jgi:hypothetical protein